MKMIFNRKGNLKVRTKCDRCDSVNKYNEELRAEFEQLKQSNFQSNESAKRDIERLRDRLETARAETSSFAVKMAHEIDSRECKITELTKLAQDLRDTVQDLREGNGFRGEYTDGQADVADEVIARANKILGSKK